MGQARRDENRVPTLLGVSNLDGTSPLMVYANPTSHALKIKATITGTVPSLTEAAIDENRVKSLVAVSESDGETPVVLGVGSTTHGLFVELT